jgi:hypothetical protein
MQRIAAAFTSSRRSDPLASTSTVAGLLQSFAVYGWCMLRKHGKGPQLSPTVGLCPGGKREEAMGLHDGLKGERGSMPARRREPP